MTMHPVFKGFLEHQRETGLALAAGSDVFTLIPEPQSPPRQYLLHFDCPTLVKDGVGVREETGFDVMVRFTDDYLTTVPNSAMVVALLSPENVWHPNVSPPFLCTGPIAPGTSLCELIYQVYEILTFQKLTPDEFDALNPDACSWARRHMDRFPLTSRPLKRQDISFEVSEIAAEAAP